jgi:hypothetical protein
LKACAASPCAVSRVPFDGIVAHCEHGAEAFGHAALRA